MGADIEIIHGSCLEIPLEAWASCDVQITDFPYSPHVHENCASVGTDGVPSGEMGTRDRDLGFAALSPELRAYGAAVAARVKRWSVVFSDWQGAHAWDAAMHDAGAELLNRWIPWIRWAQPQLSGDRPPTGSEAVLLYHAQTIGARGGRKPKAKHWNGPGNLTHFSRRALRGKDKHPTEKSIDLLLDLVSGFSDPGEIVADLCGGAGTTALACRLLDRDCVIVEQDERWIPVIRERACGPLHLSLRDLARATEWCVSVHEEASRVPAPTADDGSDVKTYERAQRRLADVARVAEKLP